MKLSLLLLPVISADKYTDYINDLITYTLKVTHPTCTLESLEQTFSSKEFLSKWNGQIKCENKKDINFSLFTYDEEQIGVEDGANMRVVELLVDTIPAWKGGFLVCVAFEEECEESNVGIGKD